MSDRNPEQPSPSMLKIDPEFRAYIPRLADEERAQLEQNLIAEGCRDPLVAWGDILIDGHNRFEICVRLGLPFTTVQMDFADREAAMDWMDAHQLGRRNLSAASRRLLLGRRYNRMKRSREANLLQNAPNGQSDLSDETTAEKLAHEHGVSEATVRRAGKFAAEVEALPDLKAAIEAGMPVAKAKRELEPTPARDAAATPLGCAGDQRARREATRLTEVAKVEEILGLRADLADAKAKISTLKAERDALKALLAEATQGDMGRALGNAQRRADQFAGRMNEYMAQVKRLEFRLKKAEARVAELEGAPVAMPL